MGSDALLVGLGNPGAQYQGTRHNAGWLVVEELARRGGIPLERVRHGARSGEGTVGGRRCLLALPQTFMNRSGEAVRPLLAYAGLEPEHLLVVHDELDLPLGRLQLRRGGGAGGHRGIQSVIAHLGTPEFWRLRLGVGRPPEGFAAERFVLQGFLPDEAPAARRMIDDAADAVACFLSEGPTRTMNRYHGDRGAEGG